MKNILKYILLTSLPFIFTACERGDEKIYVSGLEPSEFIVTGDNIVLLKETSRDIVMRAAWSTSTLVISDPDVGIAGNIQADYMQFSVSNDFAKVQEIAVQNQSKSITCLELNVIARDQGMAPGVAAPLYIRLRSAMGVNGTPVYSNVKSVTITPFLMDMSYGFIYTKEKENTGIALPSVDENGIYTGFMGVTSWYNFYFEEGDGTFWGNLGEDGKSFYMSSDEETQYNLWFPGNGGCYFTEINTAAKEWSALYVPSLGITGDITGDMEFDRSNNTWYYTFEASDSGDAQVKISTADGELYNKSGGDSSPDKTDVSMAFAMEGSTLVWGETAEFISVNIPVVGECTIILDLSDNIGGWTCEVVAGGYNAEEIPEEVFLLGIDDGISGGWNFDTTLPLYDEDNRAYAGVVNVASEWGYKISIEDGNWDGYTHASGDEYSGTLEFNGTTNIPAPAAAVYLIDISLKAESETYELTELGSEIYVVGLDDVWDFSKSLTATGTPGEYSGNITIAGPSPWGFAIHLFNGDWNKKFGGSGAELVYNGDNIKDDAGLTAGTYTFTVDLINRTCEIQ